MTDATSAERGYGAAAAVPRPRRQPPDYRLRLILRFCPPPPVSRAFAAALAASAIFPTQHGATTYAAFTSTHLSIAASLATPHACSAPPRQSPHQNRPMNPARTARCEGPPPRLSSPPPPAIGPWRPRARTSRRGNDTPTVRSGDRPRTQVHHLCRRFAPQQRRDEENTFLSCSRFLAPLARGTPPPSGWVTSSCGGRLFQSLSAVASRAHRLASSRVSSSQGSQTSISGGLAEYVGHSDGASLSSRRTAVRNFGGRA